MAPFIRDGDVITVTPLLNRLPGVGEVFAFMHPHNGKLVVHRVVARRKAEVVILGDNDATCTDGNVPLENLLGRVTGIERNGKPVWLGLGRERTLIAWLSRVRWLIPLQGWLAAWRKRCLKVWSR